MGSFNTTCAISNMSISHGNKIKVLYLAKEPFLNDYFMLSLPISATYDDYGDFNLDVNDTNPLIIQSFIDMLKNNWVDFPYSTKKTGLDEFADIDRAIKSCKVFIRDFSYAKDVRPYYRRLFNVPKIGKNINVPTWKKVQSILRKNNLKLEIDGNEASFSVKKLSRGLIEVTNSCYMNRKTNLEKAKEVLSVYYDCLLLCDKHECQGKIYEDEYHLKVMPKGAADDVNVLLSLRKDDMLRKINFPSKSYNSTKGRKQKVICLYVLEEAWNAYVNTEIQLDWSSNKYTVSRIKNELKNAVCSYLKSNIKHSYYNDIITSAKSYKQDNLLNLSIEKSLINIIEKCEISEDMLNSLILKAAESLKVCFTMGCMRQKWNTIFYHGQTSEFKLYKDINTALRNAIISLEFEDYISREDDEDDDDTISELYKEIDSLQDWYSKLSL